MTLPRDDPRQRQLDLEGKAHLGREPKVALADGLKGDYRLFQALARTLRCCARLADMRLSA
jgi:hypothetical protein